MKYVTDYVAPLGHDFTEEQKEAAEGQIGYTLHICARCDYSYVSDFVTSGDDGYADTPNPDEPEKPDGGDETTDVPDENGEPVNPDDGGSEVPDQPETPDESGDKEPSEPDTPDEDDEQAHTHYFTAEVTLDEENMTFTVDYFCECGEISDEDLQVIALDEDGNEHVLTATDGNIYDYSAFSGYYEIAVTDSLGEPLYYFELRAEGSEQPDEPDTPVEPDEGEDGGEELPDEDPDEGEQGEEKPAEDKEPENNSSLGVILIVVLIVLAAGGVAVFIVIKKKNKKDKN